MAPKKLSWICICIYLTAVAILILAILGLTGGHFVYALDDPYIHLALAEQLAHGHYGLNAGEAASPSSSLLWPFLLMPFAGSAFQTYLPLCWNLLFGSCAAALIGRSVALWFQGSSVRLRGWQLVSICCLLMLSANLASLTLIGMEHLLQVLLTIACAAGVAEIFCHRELPQWCLVAAVLAPAVRYEDLSINLAVCVALCGAKRFRLGVSVFVLSVVPLVLFGIFLRQHGLPGLPESVLVKSNTIQDQSAVHKFVQVVGKNLFDIYSDPVKRLAVVVTTVLIGFFCFRTNDRAKRYVLAGAALVGLLQLTFGQFGWLHRYEVFANIFLALVVTRLASSASIGRFSFACLLVLCAFVYVEGTVMTPFCSLAIYKQQYQMHRFVTQFYRGNYAVNDLGLVSYQRRPDTYVLDLWGLGSAEAAEHPRKEASWMAATVQDHHTPLAMLYANNFHIPLNWTAIGDVCENFPRGVVIGGHCVRFYSTDPASTGVIRSEFERFAATLPKGDTVHSSN